MELKKEGARRGKREREALVDGIEGGRGDLVRGWRKSPSQNLGGGESQKRSFGIIPPKEKKRGVKTSERSMYVLTPNAHRKKEKEKPGFHRKQNEDEI